MIYLCFDTNVYIKLLLHNYKMKSYFEPISNETSSIILELKTLAESNYYTVLLPEVIQLELEKQNSYISNDILNNCRLLKMSIEGTKSKMWNESHDLVSKLLSTVDDYQGNKLLVWNKYYQELVGFFDEKRIVKLALTPEIICETEKRKIKGLITEKQVNDSFIIDSMYCFMKQHITGEDKVYLITYDNGFFEKGKLKEKYKCENLEILIIYGIEQFEEKLNLRLIDKHLNSKKEMSIDTEEAGAYDNFDDVTDEYIEKNAKCENEHICKMVDIVESDALKQPGNVQVIRKAIIADISMKLEKCRELDSWDDKSELKLYQWLEGRTEDELPLSSVSDLILISKNIDEYYDIHLEM
ncbi:MAG: hypothetical protein VB118_07670 [Oscillospiraceae bacterium]|nr:hypothetical protein [Oscillospiraceae bacterium]